MRTFVVNVPVRACCGQPIDACTCNVTPVDPDEATQADLDRLTVNVGQTIFDAVPSVDDGDLLPLPVYDWTQGHR